MGWLAWESKPETHYLGLLSSSRPALMELSRPDVSPSPYNNSSSSSAVLKMEWTAETK